ncbi:IPExxxVDY family protein [Aquimarina sp. ERC-38]|uniref:IPExxxVDY family protein n=1 Tax=Aquimarina sp. ERC-38 TaxID=2949996 RepID=UPI0022476FAE|nr:IPExxxVDY family protein [Aquimarina sp. ERC-38]UZO81788.1 IPExxxVDY family protein [Aquimarina sp. ERC-38]
MGIQCLDLDTASEDQYDLIAIHSSLPSYRLAYLLNRELSILLSRENEDVVFHYSDCRAYYPKYQYKDVVYYTTYDLVANYYQYEVEVPNDKANDLFGNTNPGMVKKVLMPELKKAEYLLKITTESSFLEINHLVKKITDITQIITAYTVDSTQLKFKNYLIFE